MKKAYETVLFDMDGVLIDSMAIHVQAFNRVLENTGIRLSEIDIVGRSTKEILQDCLKGLVTSEEINRLAKKKSEVSLKSMMKMGVDLLMPDAMEVLLQLSERYKLGLCTSASPESASFVRNSLLQEVRFATLVHSGDVARAKPAPDIYELACARVASQPQDCLVVEDALSGVIAAIEAGCDVVFVGERQRALEDLPQVSTIPDLGRLMEHFG